MSDLYREQLERLQKEQAEAQRREAALRVEAWRNEQQANLNRATAEQKVSQEDKDRLAIKQLEAEARAATARAEAHKVQLEMHERQGRIERQREEIAFQGKLGRDTEADRRLAELQTLKKVDALAKADAPIKPDAAVHAPDPSGALIAAGTVAMAGKAAWDKLEELKYRSESPEQQATRQKAERDALDAKMTAHFAKMDERYGAGSELATKHKLDLGEKYTQQMESLEARHKLQHAQMIGHQDKDRAAKELSETVRGEKPKDETPKPPSEIDKKTIELAERHRAEREALAAHHRQGDEKFSASLSANNPNTAVKRDETKERESKELADRQREERAQHLAELARQRELERQRAEREAKVL